MNVFEGGWLWLAGYILAMVWICSCFGVIADEEGEPLDTVEGDERLGSTTNIPGRELA